MIDDDEPEYLKAFFAERDREQRLMTAAEIALIGLAAILLSLFAWAVLA